MHLIATTVSGVRNNLHLGSIESIDGVPFGEVAPLNIRNIHDRLIIVERALGELLSQLQPLSELFSVESPSHSEDLSQSDPQPLIQEELPED